MAEGGVKGRNNCKKEVKLLSLELTVSYIKISLNDTLLLNAGYMGTVLVMRTASYFFSRLKDNSVNTHKTNQLIHYNAEGEVRLLAK